MRYLSLFSGIEAATQAWEPLGWTCVGVSEIEPFACALLAQHYPGVPNLGDVTQITEFDLILLGQIDLIVFGSPCQDLSLAGKRKGLAGARSGLFHRAISIIGWARQHCGLRWAVWENVPGAFTSNKGDDFAVVVRAMGGDDGAVAIPPKGWGNEGVYLGREALVEWSTLDAQWFGVAQRRRRVFAVADFGDWASRPPILLEPESLRGNPPSRSGPQEEVAGTLTTGLGRRGAESGERRLLHVSGTLGHGTPIPTCYMPARTFGSDGGINEHFAPREIADALHTASGSGNKAPLIAFGGNNTSGSIDVAAAVNAKGGSGRMDFETETLLASSVGVRRFTPRECERLQGMRDDYTHVPYRGKAPADGPRYKALGNSMAVPVMNWIGRRIEHASWEFWS